MKKNIVYRTEIILLFLISLLLYIVILIYKKRYFLNKNNSLKDLKGYDFKNNLLIEKIKLDYDNNKFAILRFDCKACGLFVFYNYYLGCIVFFINKGYVPIVDLLSFPNIFNRFNINKLNKNPWEFFFNQPYGYTLEDVKKNSKHLKYFSCRIKFIWPRKSSIYINSLY